MRRSTDGWVCCLAFLALACGSGGGATAAGPDAAESPDGGGRIDGMGGDASRDDDVAPGHDDAAEPIGVDAPRGPDGAGPDSGGPDSGGPDSGGPDSGGPADVGPDAGGPDVVGPDAGGQDDVGPDAGGPDAVAADGVGSDTEAPDAGPPENRDPMAVDDQATTDQDTPVAVAVLDNDADPDGDGLAVAAYDQGASGAVTAPGDGTLVYTPAAGFTGDDTFGYTVTDGRGGFASATVAVTVEPVAPPNNDPVALDDTAETEVGAPVVIDVLANDSDPDPGDTVTLGSVGQPTSGSTIANADGTVTYSPWGGFSGEDAFDYTVRDDAGAEATATVRVTVFVDSGPPAAPADLAASYAGVADRIRLTWTASGDDGDQGQAARYDIYRALEPLTAAEIATGSPFTQLQATQPPGAAETLDVPIDWYTGLHYVVVVAVDNAGNGSAPSAVLVVDTEPILGPPPERLAFAPVPVGSAATLDTSVGNAGEALVDLVVGRVQVEGPPDFSLLVGAVDNDPRAWLEWVGPLRLAPGASHAVTVRFAPAAAGRQRGLLRVEHGAANPINGRLRFDQLTLLVGHGDDAPPAVATAVLAPVAAGAALELRVTVRDDDSDLPVTDDVAGVTVDLSPVGGSAAAPLARLETVDGRTAVYAATLDTTGWPAGVLLLRVAATDAAGAVGTGRLHVPVYTGAVVDVSAAAAHTTIQAGLDAAVDGDLVRVGPGTWSGPGNTNLMMRGKAVVLASAAGPAATVIDCGLVGRAFTFQDSGEPAATAVVGLTVSGCAAAAVRIVAPTLAEPVEPRFVDCVFQDCTSGTHGGAVFVEGPGAAPAFFECRFLGSRVDDALWDGGALYAGDGATVRIEGARFRGGTARNGAAVAAAGAQVTIRDAELVGNSTAGWGGAVIATDGTLIIDASAIVDNRSEGGAGAVELRGTVTATVQDTLFLANRSTNGPGALYFASEGALAIVSSAFVGNRTHSHGGAVFDALGDSTWPGAAFRDTGFFHNRSLGNAGGAIWSSDRHLRVEDCRFHANTAAAYGGALICYDGCAVSGSTFSDNATTNAGSNGGALYASAYGTFDRVVTIRGCRFEGNRTGLETPPVGQPGGSGGAVSFDQGTVVDSVFLANAAPHGRGGALHIWFDRWDGTGVWLDNVLLVGNTAPEGGGVDVDQPLPNVTQLRGCTLSANEALAGGGGGLRIERGAVTLIDSILWGNLDAATGIDSGDDLFVDGSSGPLLAVSSCDIDTAAGRIHDPAYYVNDGAGYLPGSQGNRSADPLFVGGPADDWYLSQTAAGQAADSPCLDAGSDTAAARGMDGLTTRTDGVPDAETVDLGFHR